eukprot:TRINITY_DN8254_c0_g1_i9.p1 TRINITY_DN8254_c0_g1~~TRINITY_DN8254_c0_g1_i9.p1  ORF type:complete len:190 (+),score=59.34 TRINITY_DN8254_c0_g1_i9:90-659(+)
MRGKKVTVTLTSGSTMDGYVLGTDTKDKTNSLVIAKPISLDSYQVLLVNYDCIAECALDGACSVTVPDLKQLEKTAIEDKLQRNLIRRKKFVGGLNDKVSGRVQRLFDILAKQYECEWREGNVMYFKDFDMLVSPPYNSENCEGGLNEKAKERVKHILVEFAAKNKSDKYCFIALALSLIHICRCRRAI